MEIGLKRVAVAMMAMFALVGLAAAGAPSPLSNTKGGLWEVSGAPGGRVIRQCVKDTRVLAQFEHRSQSCPRTQLRSAGDTVVFQYNCPRGGFGQSEVTVLTPRSLRIDTQGISEGLPFHYVVQARRVGDCLAH
jgi:hypothetical protein